MWFSILLYTSLSLFVAGTCYKVFAWFGHTNGLREGTFSALERFAGFARSLPHLLLTRKAFRLLSAFAFDVLLQRRTLKESGYRWLMHLLIFWGFMLLLGMHALDNFITARLFADYSPTLHPFYFLRDLAGSLVLAGVLLALLRRYLFRVPRLRTNARDLGALIIVGAIVLSGIVLEGVKITSHTIFSQMVEDYSFDLEEDDLGALESLWVQEFGLVSPHDLPPATADVLAQGREVHAESCVACHGSPRRAFASYAVSRVVRPVALALDRVGGVRFLWYLHIGLCFIGLACLPFSKLFHVLATPVSLLVNAVADPSRVAPQNAITRQMMELDACTHCGTCSLTCSAMMAFETQGNAYILPSEKIACLRSLAAGRPLSSEGLKALQTGVFLCTSCDRCTVVCPSGINLRQLWLDAREDLIDRGQPEPLLLSPFAWVRGLKRNGVSATAYDRPLTLTRGVLAGDFDLRMDPQQTLTPEAHSAPGPDASGGEATFAYCYGCQNCTTVCPVVGSFENPGRALGLLPHQIMGCLGLGLAEMAAGCRMIWDCLTCYQCQEHCPQNVRVTDLLYDLKNLATRRLAETSARGDTAADLRGAIRAAADPCGGRQGPRK